MTKEEIVKELKKLILDIGNDKYHDRYADYSCIDCVADDLEGLIEKIEDE